MVPDRSPRQIIGDFEDDLKQIMTAYQKSREFTGWDDFAKRLEPMVRAKLKEIFSELRRIGWTFSHVTHDGIMYFAVLCQNGWTVPGITLCDYCERDCERKSDVDTGKVKWLMTRGKQYTAPKPCWGKTQ